MRRVASILLLGALLSARAAAQGADEFNGVYIGGHLANTSVRPAITANGIGSAGYGADLLFGGTFKRHFQVGFDLNYYWFADKQSFTNSTTAGEKRSSLDTFGASVMIGMRTKGPTLNSQGYGASWGLNVGAGWLDATRGITYCLNCDTNGFGVRAGPFVEPFVVIGTANAMLRWHLAVRAYPSAADVSYTALAGFVSKGLF
jgi:hypothetical protein